MLSSCPSFRPTHLHCQLYLQQPHLLCLIAAAHLVIISPSTLRFNFPSVPAALQRCHAIYTPWSTRPHSLFGICLLSRMWILPLDLFYSALLFFVVFFFLGSDLLQMLISCPRPDTFIFFPCVFFLRPITPTHLSLYLPFKRHLHSHLHTFLQSLQCITFTICEFKASSFSFLLLTRSREHNTIWNSPVTLRKCVWPLCPLPPDLFITKHIDLSP